MAKFILGAIVTDVAGSIGGTTLRRGVRGHSMYNKQQKRLGQSITNNSMRLRIGQVMRNWSSLDAEQVALWNLQATNFVFPDKFGNEVNLTGRQLYIKLNSQSLVYTEIVPDVSLLDSAVEQPIIKDITCSLGTELIEVEFENEIVAGNLTFALKQKPKAGGVKPHAHFKVNFTREVAESTTINVYELVLEQFPTITAGQYYELHIYNINTSGFVSAVTAVKFLVSE